MTRVIRSIAVLAAGSACLACTPASAGSPGSSPAARIAPPSTGLILEADEGERFVRRQYGFPMIIKVDPQNGNSKQMVVGTEEIPAGRAIPLHRHSHADELIVLQEGTAIATLGDKRDTVHAGATIFIPQNEWVGLENVGSGSMKILFVFSALGFEEYLRATSVPEGSEVKPFTPEEIRAIREKYQKHIAFRSP